MGLEKIKRDTVYRLAIYALRYAMEHQHETFQVKTAVLWQLEDLSDKQLLEISKTIREFAKRCKESNTEIFDPAAWLSLETQARCIRIRRAEKEVKK